MKRRTTKKVIEFKLDGSLGYTVKESEAEGISIQAVEGKPLD